jgi:hypothetical protein
MAARQRFLYVWDYDITEQQFREILDGRSVFGRLNQDWAARRLLEYAPYAEIVRYLKTHRDHVDRVASTLAYFVGAVLARRASVPALFSVALMDQICPPSTVYAAYNAWAGPKEIRAWTVPVGSTAPQAAGAIHTDFERGFIRAETIAYDDYITHKGENGAREAGRLRLEGKEYVMQEGDVMHFRFNV